MSPGKHAVEIVLIQQAADAREVLGVQARNEAGFKRNATDAEFVRASQEVFERHAMRRWGLLRINFAEESVIAVAVDRGFHES